MNERRPVLEARDVHFAYRQRQSLLRSREYPAIRGVSFTIFEGETVGVIGRNGCGKSTLLRLVAGIYQPDAGEVRSHCPRVSLLSLSLGFDPQLTGRENAVLSGMLSGSTRSQVESELDEIIRFAELGRFIDEPIKTYSTGMRSRLGFAVALKLRTDLMLLDEVLSVGDQAFREKAEKAMVDRINSKQTVLLVSHSLPQTQALCDRVIWLDKGCVVEVGEPDEVIARYQDSFNETSDSAQR